MITIGNESVENEIKKIFNDNDIDIYEPIDDIFFDDSTKIDDDVLNALNITTDIFDNNYDCDEISHQLAQNNISMEVNFFNKLWDVLLTIIKKIYDSLVNFFKIVINFFKRLINYKKDLKQDSENILKDENKLKEYSDTVINKVLNKTESKEDSSENIINNIIIIAPGKEDGYLKTISDLYKNDFIGEFRKISFIINSIADLSFDNDKHQNIINEKIEDFESKNQDYKKKIVDIIKTLKSKKSEYLITIDKNNGNDVIKNALKRNKMTNWGSNDILTLMDSSNSNRLILQLTQTIKKIKSKPVSESMYQSFKKLSINLNMIISFTNKMFSESFSYIKAYLTTENINSKLSKMVINLHNKEKNN